MSILSDLRKDLLEIKSQQAYRSALRSAARGFWGGELSMFGFVDAMVSAIEREFPNAWAEGALRCGIAMEDLSQAEKDRLAGIIGARLPIGTGRRDG